MDPRKLLYLATVIEHGSLKKAAKQLQISQPALSTSMDRLERSLGGQLLERGPAGVTPTPLGEVMYAHARLIRDELKIAERRLRGYGRDGEAVIAFGTLPSLASTIVPKAVCSWRAENPTSTLRIIERIQLDLLLSLTRGQLDFIIAQTECYDLLEGLRQRVLFRDRLYVIGRPSHPAFRNGAVSWSELGQFPWILQMVGRQRTLLEKVLASEQVELPQQLTECGSINCLKALVAQSDSLAMLPASAIQADVREKKLRPLPIASPLLNRDIALIFRERMPLDDASRDLIARIAAAGHDLGDEVTYPAVEALAA